MDFDFFEKLSELETNIHFLKMDISTKDECIKKLEDQNAYLRRRLESARANHPVVKKKHDKETSTSDIAEVIQNCFENNSEKSIADILKETSENAMQKTGYVFDQRTGLYFDKISGYYYDPENQLFFEPRSGVYYSYNSETHEYSYHSKISSELSRKFQDLVSKGRKIFDQPARKEYENLDSDKARRNLSPIRDCRCIGTFSTSKRPLRQENYTRSRRYRSRSGSSEYRGRYRRSFSRSDHDSRATSPYRLHECRKSSSRAPRTRVDRTPTLSAERDSERHSTKEPNTSTVTCVAASAVIYPPSMRLMVISSKVLSTGMVGVITPQQAASGWGCLGKNVNYCPVLNLMDDVELEEIHCEISFRSSEETYLIMDRNSKTGTFINGLQLDGSEPRKLCHGDVLRIGSSRFLAHIHPGSETCDQCESETVQAAFLTAVPTESPSTSPRASIDTSVPCDDMHNSTFETGESKESLRRAKLNELKSKYGLKGFIGPRELKMSVKNAYQDRAAGRRALEKRVYVSANSAQDERPMSRQPSSASVFSPINDENVGARMLSKMGWNRGEGLGKEKSGRSEPIAVGVRVNPRACLGASFGVRSSSNIASLDATPRELRQARIMASTRERYRRLDFD